MKFKGKHIKDKHPGMKGKEKQMKSKKLGTTHEGHRTKHEIPT
jgi:hypothetical protein